MAVSTLSADFVAVSDHGSVMRLATSATSPAALRSLLVIGCVACALAATGIGDPVSVVRADPQLALLLRGMALIKGAVVLAALAVLWWRFGHPVRAGTAVAYISGTAALAGATVLIWQLSLIPLAALTFHMAALIVLVAAWRDGAAKFKPLHGAG